MEKKGSLSFNKYPFLKELGLSERNDGCYRDGQWAGNGNEVTQYSPHNNEAIAIVKQASEKDYQDCITAMEKEKAKWMTTPGPVRGEIVRQIGEAMRLKKEPLANLICLEMGKIKSEALGEV
mmetsp:Transcript_31976/g.31269  ORF Transcript_31976/g.31269 Transcript_31976/m.31269 type:complete len:122 (-) Transcript_31976:1207-1572(-)